MFSRGRWILKYMTSTRRPEFKAFEHSCWFAVIMWQFWILFFFSFSICCDIFGLYSFSPTGLLPDSWTLHFFFIHVQGKMPFITVPLMVSHTFRWLGVEKNPPSPCVTWTWQSPVCHFDDHLDTRPSLHMIWAPYHIRIQNLHEFRSTSVCLWTLVTANRKRHTSLQKEVRSQEPGT